MPSKTFFSQSTFLKRSIADFTTWLADFIFCKFLNALIKLLSTEEIHLQLTKVLFLISVSLCFFQTYKLLLENFVQTAFGWLFGLSPFFLVPISSFLLSKWSQSSSIFFTHIQNDDLSAECVALSIISLTNIWVNPWLDKNLVDKQATYHHPPNSRTNRKTFLSNRANSKTSLSKLTQSFTNLLHGFNPLKPI